MSVLNKRGRDRTLAVSRLERVVACRLQLVHLVAVLQDLIVYQLAEELRNAVNLLTDQPAARRDFRLRDQIRSSAGSVAAKIAEGYGRQRHSDFARFVEYATGSLRETETWLRDGATRGLWSADDLAACLKLCRRLTPALQNLRRYLKSTKTPA